jgi:hypothetical protein
VVEVRPVAPDESDAHSGGTVAGLNKTLQERLASGDTSLAAPPLPQKQ